MGASAWAQEAAVAPAGAALEASSAADSGEILVTARRREESAQRVPVAVTALSPTTLEERHIVTGQDLQGQVPSLSVSQGGQSRDVSSFTVRGQGTILSAAPAVVQYTAEVPNLAGKILSIQGLPGQFLDLSSVQVLRGPQGTLFGRNSTGGAVLLEPARPTDTYEGHFRLQFGNYESSEVEAVVNVPVTDQLQIRLAGQFSRRDGFTKDVVTAEDYDNRRFYNGRLGVLWKPTDRIENYLMVAGSRSTTNGSGWIVDSINVPYIDQTIFGGFGGCEGVGLGPQCSALTDAVVDQQGRSKRRVSLGPGTFHGEIEGWNAINHFSYELTDNLTLRNIISYSRLKALSPTDNDGNSVTIPGVPYGLYHSNTPGVGPGDNLEQFTGELQLQGDGLDDKLQYALGAYYEEVKTIGQPLIGGDVFFAPSLQTAVYKITSKAVYGQATFDFGSFAEALAGLKLTGGIRYTWDRVKGAGASFSLNPDGSVASCDNGVNNAPSTISDCYLGGTTKSDAPTWTIGLDYGVTDDILLYGKVSRGYKTGGINFYAVTPSNGFYKPEYVTTYEAGFKSAFPIGSDARLILNAALFQTDYDDIQVVAGDFNPVTFGSGAAVFNAASARIKGIEIESTLRLFRRFELSGNYSHLDSKYNDYTINNDFGQIDCSGQTVFGTVDLSCLPFSGTPKDQYSISARYDLPVSEDIGEMALSAVYAYTGKQYQLTTQLLAQEPGGLIEGYGVLNISVNWNKVFQSPMDLTFFMANVTNNLYRTSGTGVFQTLGVSSSLYGEPRTFGFGLRYSW